MASSAALADAISKCQVKNSINYDIKATGIRGTDLNLDIKDDERRGNGLNWDTKNDTNGGSGLNWNESNEEDAKESTSMTSFLDDVFKGEDDNQKKNESKVNVAEASQSEITANSVTTNEDEETLIGEETEITNNEDHSRCDGQDNKLLWICDPIDGTTNFQAGLPMFCVSIGVVSLENDEPVVIAGVIYNPILNEMVTAVRGRGCYLNGERLQPRSAVPDLSQALVNIGFPVSSPTTLKASATAVAAMATKVRGLRMIASASQVMSWVAQGKITAYVSWDLNAWDVAAGMVAVEEAGGFVAGFDGSRASISDRDLIVTCREDGGRNVVGWQIQRILEQHNLSWY